VQRSLAGGVLGSYAATMGALDDWPLAMILRTERLSLEPLRLDHADEMAPLLDDPRLFAFTGGSPARWMN
jgi:RimJ/RimL family protein N-acetyltransferase